MSKSSVIALLSVAMAGSVSVYGAGSCVVCPFGMKCEGGTAAPVDDADALQAAKDKLGITSGGGGGSWGALAMPDGVYAKSGRYLKAAAPTHATQSKHIKIKAGTTFVIGGQAIAFTEDTNKSLSYSTEGADYDICINDELDTTSAEASATTNSTGIKTVQHNTTCGAGWLKIGGFHSMPCASADTATLAAAHPYYNAKQGAIMPNSVWTLKHHPASVEGGYVYDPAMNIWVMIYLPTLVSNASYYQDTLANNTIPISAARYNPTGCEDQTGYCDGADYPGTYVQANSTTTQTSTTNINDATKLVSRFNQRVANQMEYREGFDLLAGGGAKPLSDAQFSSAASGSIEGAAGPGTQGYNATCRLFGGPPTRLNISNIGVIGMTGEYYQDIEQTAGTDNYNQAGDKGSYSAPGTRVFAGGDWYNDATYVGSRYRSWDYVNNRYTSFAARGSSPDTAR